VTTGEQDKTIRDIALLIVAALDEHDETRHRAERIATRLGIDPDEGTDAVADILRRETSGPGLADAAERAEPAPELVRAMGVIAAYEDYARRMTIPDATARAALRERHGLENQSMTGTSSTLPQWDDLSDLDRGAALLHIHKRDYEGREYAIENYPARYFDHPALTALDAIDASDHAATLETTALDLEPGEYERLYDLALAADRKR
jgi:hypothetical protein